MWIVIWDPFLMKKLIKNEICGSVNSIYVHCSRQKVNICDYCSLNSNRNTPKRVKKKKKKKKKNKTQLGNANLESKHTLTLFTPSLSKKKKKKKNIVYTLKQHGPSTTRLLPNRVYVTWGVGSWSEWKMLISTSLLIFRI